MEMLFAPVELNPYERYMRRSEELWRERLITSFPPIDFEFNPYYWISGKETAMMEAMRPHILKYRESIKKIHSEEFMKGQAFGL